MKNLFIGILFLFVLISLGCAPYTKDMRLVESAYQDILDNKFKDAEPKLLDALKENPDNPYAQVNLGVVYQNTGREDKAAAMYEKVIKADPDDRATKASVDKEVGKPVTEVAKNNLALIKNKK